MNTIEYTRMFECEDTHWWYVALHKLINRYIARERKAKGRIDMLDAGCGTGRLCQLSAGLATVKGCDSSDQALALCGKRNLPFVFKADLNIADLGQNLYDVITSIDVLYHKAIDDDGLVLNKLYIALKPGGVLILNLPAYEFLKSSHDIAVHTKKRYTRALVSALLIKNGFVVEKISYRIAFLFFPIAGYRWALRLLHRHLQDQAVESDVQLPSRFINRLLLLLTLAENYIVERRSLPFGLSVFAVARKTGPRAGEAGSGGGDRAGAE